MNPSLWPTNTLPPFSFQFPVAIIPFSRQLYAHNITSTLVCGKSWSYWSQGVTCEPVLAFWWMWSARHYNGNEDLTSTSVNTNVGSVYVASIPPHNALHVSSTSCMLYSVWRSGHCMLYGTLHFVALLFVIRGPSPLLPQAPLSTIASRPRLTSLVVGVLFVTCYEVHLLPHTHLSAPKP